MRIEGIRGTMKMGEMSNEVQESSVKWYGHVLRIDGDYVGKRMMLMEMPGERSIGRRKRRWMDSIRNDKSERELSGEEAQDRVHWSVS